jgi:hypothetical protein
MAFRVLIVGSPSFHDYAKLRSILDIALPKRAPDVVLVTTGGSGLLSALVASYARSRNLTVEVAPIERYPLDVQASPMARVVAKVDAAVVVWPESTPETNELLALDEAKGLPVHVVEPPRDEGGQGKNRCGGRCGFLKRTDKGVIGNASRSCIRADFITPNQDAKPQNPGDFSEFGLLPILAGQLREAGRAIADSGRSVRCSPRPPGSVTARSCTWGVPSATRRHRRLSPWCRKDPDR